MLVRTSLLCGCHPGYENVWTWIEYTCLYISVVLMLTIGILNTIFCSGLSSYVFLTVGNIYLIMHGIFAQYIEWLVRQVSNLMHRVGPIIIQRAIIIWFVDRVIFIYQRVKNIRTQKKKINEFNRCKTFPSILLTFN